MQYEITIQKYTTHRLSFINNGYKLSIDIFKKHSTTNGIILNNQTIGIAANKIDFS